MQLQRRIELMEQFTTRYQETEGMPKSLREVECLKTVLPEVFVPPNKEDWFVGRMIMLPIGHGLEWAHLGGSILTDASGQPIIGNSSTASEANSAGPSYYALLGQLQTMKENTENQDFVDRLKRLIQFWQVYDTHQSMVDSFREKYPDNLYHQDPGNFLVPMLVLTRLSGIELDYRPLLAMGVPGFRDHLQDALRSKPTNEFLLAGIKALDLLEESIMHYIEILSEQQHTSSLIKEPDYEEKKKQMIASLKELLERAPTSFHSAIQLMYLYSQLAGVVNYGRLDVVLGDFLVADLDRGLLDEQTARSYIEALWELINESCNRGNGRVIIGGQGRENATNANLFTKLAIEATINKRLIKPQLTLRMDESVPEEIYELALEAIAQGCTFPMLYNDALNVNGVKAAMEIELSDAQQYVPYGCGEYVIWGRGTGSPNVCVNFTKVLQLLLNQGVDPFDGVYRGGDYTFPDLTALTSFQLLEEAFYDYLDYILKATAHFQLDSYQYLADRSSFVYASLLMNDCIKKGKPILDGGVRYYGGVNEFYGFTNAIDSLAALKKAVYEDRDYSLAQVVEAVNHHFNGNDRLKDALLQSPKFGNDDEQVDSIAVRLHEKACNLVRDYGRKVGLDSFLAVNINNNTNTHWGRKTGASYDGRATSEHLAPGNNPHSGRDVNGITAMLNSISKLRADLHAGYVQNLKCSPRLLGDQRDKVKALFSGYFNQVGGTQLMVSVVDQQTLLEARANPKAHQNLIVRVGGFSAKFVELDEHTQLEIIERTCHD